LEIDSNYELARRNLEALPAIRQTGRQGFRVQSLFEGQRIEQGLTFILDDE
jgi:hypothetical protein